MSFLWKALAAVLLVFALSEVSTAQWGGVQISDDGTASVATAQGLVAALRLPTVSTIWLVESITLPDDGSLSLPVRLEQGRNVVITSPPPWEDLIGPYDLNSSQFANVSVLDFGNLYPVVIIGSGASFGLANIITNGQVNRYVPEVQGLNLPTTQGYLYWPALVPEAGASLSLSNVAGFTVGRSNCTEPVLMQYVLNNGQIFGGSQMVGMDVASNSTWLLGSHNFPILVTSPSGETLGEARLAVNGSRWMCLENPLYSQQQSAASTTATQGTKSSSGDGLSAGAWVGVAAGIAVAALAGSGAIAAVVLRRRHRRRLNMPYPSVYRNGASVSEGGKSPKASDAASALSAVDQLNISQEGLGMAALLRVRFGGLDGLEIGQLIGRGAHGRIYRGTLRGTPVAVKVIDHTVGPDSKQTHTSKVVAAEVGLLLALSHPRIIRVLKCATIKLKSPGSGLTGGNSGASAIEDRRMNAGSPAGRGVATGAPVTPEDLENPSTPPPQIADRIPSMQGTSGESSSAELQRGGAGSGSEFTSGTQHGSDMSGPGLYETWLVLEYANAGSLYQALFIKRRFHDADGAPNVLLILSILIEVAEGMAYLHECDIVHGDLKPDNILLKSGDGHNSLTAVVADFGLARLISDGSLKQSMVQTTGIVGTIEYMSPELVGHGLLSRKADVWSFGLIMLEMWTGEARFKGMSAAQILYASSHNEQLPLPEGSPYHQLVKRCLVHESRLRPSFEELLKELHVCYATVRSL